MKKYKSQEKNSAHRPKLETATAVDMVSGLFYSILIACLMAAAVMMTSPALAKAEEESVTPDSNVLISSSLAPVSDEMVRKELSGTIGAKNTQGIAVVYENDLQNKISREIWMPFGEETYLDQYNSLADISEGDQVLIIYDEDRNITGKLILRGIRLVKKAVAEAEEVEDYDAEAEAGA